MENKQISFDGNNPALIRELMKKYGDSKFPFYGTNKEGEEIEIHIGKTSVIHKTYQKNGWLRANHYDENGLPAGEIFEGRWR